MAKLTKGIFSDTTPQDTPEGSYVFAKNIIDHNVLNVKENEDGFLNAGLLAPYTVIGSEQVGKDFVVFSTNNTSSEIGLVTRNGETLTYSTVYSDPDLAFNTAHPIIDIEYRIDVNNQRTVAWTDNFNTPRLLNIDNPPATGNVQELNIFRDVTNPTLSSYAITDTGGSLPTGAIIIITKYRNSSDLTETNWFIHEHVFYINDDPLLGSFQNNDGAVGGLTTSKAISLSFTGNDLRYDTLIVGYAKYTNGVITAVQALTIPNQSTVNTIIAGSEVNTAISVDSIVTPTTSYSTAQSLEQLSGRLFMANLSSDPFPELQQTALDITVNWRLDMLNAVVNQNSHKDVTPPTFMPGEVYALYLGVELNKGGWRCYHIPGRAPHAGDTAILSNYGIANYKKFQVNDTISSGTEMNYWENSNEVYPNTSDFNSGSQDLRGLAVRHHRMPTLQYLKTSSTASSDVTFGVTRLPRLSLVISNVTIPAPIQSKIKRWKIFYAKKTAQNSLSLGTDLYHSAMISSGIPSVSNTTGGNWKIQTTHAGPVWLGFDTIDTTKIRCHSLDYLYNRTLPAPSYVAYAYKLTSQSTTDTSSPIANSRVYKGFGTMGNVTITGSGVGTVASAVIDYTVNAASSSVGTKIAALSNFTYLPQGSLNGQDNNVYSESNYVATLAPGFSPSSSVAFATLATRGTDQASLPNQFSGASIETLVGMYGSLLSSVHASFTNQTLIPTEQYSAPTSTSILATGGDGFICYMSYVTAQALNANPVGTLGVPSREGVRVWNAYIGYSRNNWNFRYQTTGDVGTYYNPKTDPRNMYTISRVNQSLTTAPFITIGEATLLDLNAVNFNSLNYNIDYSVHNELISPVIFDPVIPSVTRYPNTIIFTPQGSEESQVTSWKTFLSGDRYVIPKNKGEITNLQGLRNQQLLINTQYSFFRTRTDIQMATAGASSGENVFFRSASIFTLPPEEVLPTSQGYAGTQHKQSCRLTKAGYFFVDDIQGKAFLYSGELKEVSENGLRNFFKNSKLDQANQGTEAWTSNGYITGWDERNNRLILTKKEGVTSWTLSYNPSKETWVSYHDYTPDHLFMTVDNILYGVKDNKFYIMNLLSNNTQKGIYFDNVTPFSSYIDQVYGKDTEDGLVVNVKWVTEVYPNQYTNGQPVLTNNYTTTLSHLTLRGLEHCTDRVALVSRSDYNQLYKSNTRNLNRTWYFDDIRDISIQPGFTKDFYNNYDLDSTKLNINTPWYAQRRFIDKYVICRFEFDNTQNLRLLFLDGEVEVQPVSK